MTKNILIVALVILATILFWSKGCKEGETKVEYRTVRDTVSTVDTVQLRFYRTDTVTNSLVLEERYFDTVYMDSLYVYTSNIKDSLVEINERILSKGEVVQHEIDWCVDIPYKEIIRTNTVTIKETIKEKKKVALMYGLYGGYPFNVGGSIGLKDKKGNVYYVQKDFLQQNVQIGWMRPLNF